MGSQTHAYFRWQNRVCLLIPPKKKAQQSAIPLRFINAIPFQFTGNVDEKTPYERAEVIIFPQRNRDNKSSSVQEQQTAIVIEVG